MFINVGCVSTVDDEKSLFGEFSNCSPDSDDGDAVALV
jgi:hypothetical protein